MNLSMILTTVLAIQNATGRLIPKVDRAIEIHGNDVEIDAAVADSINENLSALSAAISEIDSAIKSQPSIGSPSAFIATDTPTASPIIFNTPAMHTERSASTLKVATKDTAKTSVINKNPILAIPKEYPAGTEGFGPTFKLGTHMGLLIRNANWAKIRFGNGNKWVELTFNKSAAKIARADYEKYGIDKSATPQFYAGVTYITSESAEPKWSANAAQFFPGSRSVVKGGYFLALDVHFSAKGKPDINGMKLPVDSYQIFTPVVYDENGHSGNPASAADLDYDPASKIFPFTEVKEWSGGIFDSSRLPKDLVKSFGNTVSFAASPGATVIVSRSKNDRNLAVPVVATKSPTKKPTDTTKYPSTYPTKPKNKG